MRTHDGSVPGAPVTSVTGAPGGPPLTGALREHALHLASSLARSLGRSLPRAPAGRRDGSLASGSAGLAVAVASLARTRSGPDAAAAASAHIDAAVDVLATEPLTSSFYSGFPGIAWAVDLIDRLLGSADADRNSRIDDAVIALLERYPEQAPYDLIDGLTGLGAYALARWPLPGAVACVAGVVEQLAKRARHDRDGVFWWTPPSRRGPRLDRYQPGGVDLGVAHGIAGVIPFLARAHRLGLVTQTTGPLLDGAVSWLLAHLVDGPSGPTVPYFVTDGAEPGPARSAWCYGDPGVAIALLLAARDVGEPAWAARATGLAVRAAARPAAQSGVIDAGLCHGSSGLEHLFNRMYQLTAEPALAEAARFWAGRTIELCSGPEPFQDSAAAANGQPSAFSGLGLLEGAAGAALALEAAATAQEPVWDQMLLVSTSDPVGRQAL